ncbi:MAG: ferrochelatase [Chlamydiae bacterium CG10_big_fil_rev_8_21_14_0_10_42_34]|nr:MAG: ferrochelatase [Chlamydiae bacterium CG10_big_fil_rev_8_21_14_0_10_42_34]
MSNTYPILLVNFGGPRNLDEVAPFLKELLCDRDVIRTRFPKFFHNWLFSRIARKRATKVKEDYELIGGASPIYFDTENLAKALSEKLQVEVLTFHRYLPATHAASIEKMKKAKELKVLPLFPQYCSATTGSIARFLSHLPPNKLKWIKSYAKHPAFIKAYQKRIANFLTEKGLKEEDTVLFFSAHGVPKSFIQEGDIYESECIDSFNEVMKAFPKTLGRLCYQSKFGRGEWLRPYTNEACDEICNWNEGRKQIVFIPISFTSDHIETLFEIEKLYLPIIESKGLNAYRCPALNLESYWVDALLEIAQGPAVLSSKSLIR